MNKETTNFLLKYAKIGVLKSRGKLDDIESEELLQEYIEIKKELLGSKDTEEIRKNTPKPGENKEGAVKKWFKGIGERQRKYQKENKGNIMG